MKNKKTFLLTIVAIITLIILVVGASFAYFTAQGGAATSANINISTSTVDTFTFTTGDAINIIADQTSFANGKDSLLGQTFAKATLTANNSTNEATENYYVYLNIENNTFKYTLGESSPELLLTVTAPDGTEVTSINGLEYKTATDNKGVSISGFDVTTSSGIIALVNNDEITAGTSSSVGKASNEESWNIKLTFVNYEDDQTANAGAALSAKVMVQKEKKTVANICKSGQSLSSCIIAMNGIDDTLYHHDGNLTNGIDDNSYRYAGASSSVNNYVCFGSTDATCPTDNLYRIIGVFGDQVKLIKSTSIGDMAWSSNSKNTWSTASLNTYLNGTYLTSLGTYASKIAQTTWKVGGNTSANIYSQVPSAAYQNEVGTSSSSTTYNAKIGLMYVSDYGFAAAPAAWTTILNKYNGSINGSTIKSLNWMYLGSYEWTISRNAGSSSYVFVVFSNGAVFSCHAGSSCAVRPVFYLESSATYSSGFGTSDNPIRLS